MRPREVEAWALQVLQQIVANPKFESSLVEFKREWIDPQQAARRLAAHANSARGNAILWLVGVDKSSGVTGAASNDLAKWWPQVKAEFDHVAPDLTDVVVDWEGKAVVALVFATELAPFVVKNPKFGQPGGGPVRWEVPWRQGTAVDSASRSHLLLLLAPTARLPQFEILEAQLAIVRSSSPQGSTADWDLSMLIYVTPRSTERIAIAAHRVAASHRIENTSEVVEYSGEKILVPMGWYGGGFMPFTREPQLHPTIRGTNFDLTLDGPGLIKIIAKTFATNIGDLAADRIGTLRIAPTGSELAAELHVALRHNPRADWPERWTAP